MKAEQIEENVASTINGRTIARNTLINLIGQVVPRLVGLAAVPFIVRELGPSRYGIFSLGLLILGYFGFFDLGFGLATTKLVAEYRGKGYENKISGVVWSSLTAQLLFGILGGLALAASTPFLVSRLLHIPPLLTAEAERTLFCLAASLPVVLSAATLQGVLGAGQRFDLVNAVQIPLHVSTFLIPAVGFALGLGLPQVVVVLLLVRVAAALVSLTFCFRVYPSLRHRVSFEAQSLRLLARCGSWVTVTNFVQPAFLYLDRFLIGALLSITAVAYYSAPLQLASSLAIFPASLVATLFPTFSAVSARNDAQALEKICGCAFKALLLIEGPLVLLTILWAPQILRLSLGEDFAAQSTFSFQTLAIGMLIFSMAYVPFNLLQAAGRPDLPAKFCLLELPLYAAGLWFLVGRMGIDGAALAWTLRAGLDATLLAGACSVLKLVPLEALARNGLWRSLVMFVVLAMIISPMPLVAEGILRQGIVAGVGMCLFAAVVWRYGLDSTDKGFLASVFRRLATNSTRWS